MVATPTGTSVPTVPVIPVMVPDRPVQASVVIPPDLVGVTEPAVVPPPGVNPMSTVVTAVVVLGPTVGSTWSVIFSEVAEADPVYVVAGRVAEATTDASTSWSRKSEQVNAVPAAAVPTWKVAVPCAAL